ncbi:MAG: hypothetical protein ACO2PM_22820 [Pyrobaculum sp.]|jgi:hypothetical protein
MLNVNSLGRGWLSKCNVARRSSAAPPPSSPPTTRSTNLEVVADLANATFYAAVLLAIKRGLNQLLSLKDGDRIEIEVYF